MTVFNDELDEYIPSSAEILDEISRLKLAGYVGPDDPDYDVEEMALTVIDERRRHPGASYDEIFARSLLATVSLINPNDLSADARAEFDKLDAVISYARALVDARTVKA